MATWRPENSMLTQRGVEILNKLKAGVGSITVTRIVAGSGRVAESLLYQQTSISGVQKPMTISGKNTTDVGSEITFYIENKDFAEPYDLHQIGIYVTHPDYVGEQLYHISQCDANDYDTIPAISYTPVTQGYSVFMEHGNSSSVNITVDPSGMINTVQFNEFKESTADMFQHINTDIVNLQNGKAPAGYGLGLSGPPSTDDCDTATKNGWYHVYGATLNKPFGKVGALLVVCRESTQMYQLFFVGETYSTGGSCIIVRSMYGGEWGPWEWVNPPFDKNVVYPTTERHLGNPVYKKMDSNGVIWWSTDQSTWKVEATRVGAMESLLTGGFLDGIPNLNEYNNRITGPGWFRILRTKGNDSFLIHLGHGYNSSGPEDMLFHVCIDRYCPSIVILSNSIYSAYKFYTKIRITYDDTYTYVDFYYDRNNPNSVQSNIWWFSKNRAGCMTEPLLLSKVDDAPSGETIVLTQDVSVIDSGNVLTVGADNILPPSKGGTGVRSLDLLRRQVGSGLLVDCKAGSSVNITLPDNGTYLICSNDNARQGVILVQTGSSFGKIARIISLSTPIGWSYVQGNNVLTLSETNGNFDGGFWVTSFGMYVYSGG